MTVMDPEPEGEGAHAVTAGRDAYVAGRDQFVFNVNVPKDESGASGEPGPGRRLFSARIHRRSGQLSVAFGADDTLVVAEKDTTVHRWSLRDHAPLPGAPAGPAPGFSLMRVDIGTR